MALVSIPCKPCDRYVNPATVETVDVIEQTTGQFQLRLRFVSGRCEETPPMPKPEALVYVRELAKGDRP